jgi:hypothetical protein
VVLPAGDFPAGALCRRGCCQGLSPGLVGSSPAPPPQSSGRLGSGWSTGSRPRLRPRRGWVLLPPRAAIFHPLRRSLATRLRPRVRPDLRPAPTGFATPSAGVLLPLWSAGVATCRRAGCDVVPRVAGHRPARIGAGCSLIVVASAVADAVAHGVPTADPRVSLPGLPQRGGGPRRCPAQQVLLPRQHTAECVALRSEPGAGRFWHWAGCDLPRPVICEAVTG